MKIHDGEKENQRLVLTPQKPVSTVSWMNSYCTKSEKDMFNVGVVLLENIMQTTN